MGVCLEQTAFADVPRPRDAAPLRVDDVEPDGGVFVEPGSGKIEGLQVARSAIDVAVAADAGQAGVDGEMSIDQAGAGFYRVLPGGE